MPDRSKLQVGDEIRLLAVPKADLEQRDREFQRGLADAGWTANTIEHIINQCAVVTIDRIDENGMPWFDVEIRNEAGEIEEHSLAVMENDSWEHV